MALNVLDLMLVLQIHFSQQLVQVPKEVSNPSSNKAPS